MIFIILIGLISLFLDVMDIPTKCDLYFNLDYWNMYIVVALFIFGYRLIDKKTLDKENNKKALLEYFIKDTYLRCLNMLNFIENNIKIVNKLYIYQMKKDNNNELKDFNIYKDVYKNEEYIYELIKEGVGEKKIIKEFFDIHSKYMEIIGCLAYNDDTEKIKRLIKDLKEILVNKEV